MAELSGSQHELADLQHRLRMVKLGILVIMAVLGLRLWQLQVYEGAYYRELSENNRTRTVIREPARGLFSESSRE